MAVELFRYVLRYTIPFVGNNIGDAVEYRVELHQRRAITATIPDAVELDGAPSPFEFTLASDDDPTIPIRTSTAKISFVDDIDITSLLPSSGFDWRVRLVRVQDEVAVFTGYLTGEVFTQPFIEGPNIVTVNAVSAMVPALASAMDIVGHGSLAIGWVIAQAARLVDIEEVVMPAIYMVDVTTSPGHYTDLLRLRFSAWRYMRFADNAQVTGDEFECDPYNSAISDICALLGWSMVDVGDGKLYFVAPGYSGSYMRLSPDELEFDTIFTPRLSLPTSHNLTDYDCVDSADTMEMRQGYRSVLLTADVSDMALQMGAIADQVREWSYIRESVAVKLRRFTDPYDLIDGTAEVGKKIATFSERNISIPRYRAEGVYSENNILLDVVWSRVTDGSEDETADAFTRYFESDSCSPADASIESGEAKKREWSFTPFFRVKEKAVIAGTDTVSYRTLGDENYLLKIIGSAGLLIGGAIVIDFEMRASLGDGFHIPADYYVAGGDIEGTMLGVVAGYNTDFWGKTKRVIAGLKVGDVWWNGEEWAAEEARFEIPISVTAGEWHGVVSNKTVDMPFAGGKGLYIPLTYEVEGQVEFYIYPRLTEVTEEADRPEGDFVLKYDGSNAPFVDIKGLSVSFAPRLDYVDVSSLSSTYYRDFSRSFPHQREVSLRLHSRVNNATQLSLIYTEAGQPLDTLWRGDVQAKPERFLLDESQRLFATAMRRYRRGITLQALCPIDTWGGNDDYIQIPTGASINYAEGTGEIYLSEIKPLEI